MNQPSNAAYLVTLAVGVVAVGLAWKLVWGRKKKYGRVGKIAELYVYPVKSCKGVKMNQVKCTKLGARVDNVSDRNWAISLPNGTFLSQRQEPKMALIEPSFQGNLMQLKAPDMDPVSFPAFLEPNDNNRSKIIVWGVTLPSVDLGDEVSKWLSSYLKREGLRMHYSAPSLEKRECFKSERQWRFPAKPEDCCVFADDSPYMILSNQSIASLNTKLDNKVTVLNFRPNILLDLDGCEPHTEDLWSHVQIGDTSFRALDHCTRCILTTVDPEKGVKAENGEPLATLRKFRSKEGYGKSPCFGMFHAVDSEGFIKVGDPVYALEA